MKIENRIKKEIIKHVDIMAGEKKYSSMSSGEKSIFGIQFKLDKMPNTQDILFLDQPEDNLDNKTIVNGLVDRLKAFKRQSFIVTHNANIGILTGTNKVIVADIHKEEHQYKEGILRIQDKNSDSDASSFLEGGVSSLNNRYTIINNKKGENYEN
jgi:ATPase subunit of ABC transporter with duplicated ATPase domains